MRITGNFSSNNLMELESGPEDYDLETALAGAKAIAIGWGGNVCFDYQGVSIALTADEDLERCARVIRNMRWMPPAQSLASQERLNLAQRALRKITGN